MLRRRRLFNGVTVVCERVMSKYLNDLIIQEDNRNRSHI